MSRKVRKYTKEFKEESVTLALKAEAISVFNPEVFKPNYSPR